MKLSKPIVALSATASMYLGLLAVIDIERSMFDKLTDILFVLPAIMSSCLAAWWLRFLRWRALLHHSGHALPLRDGFLVYVGGFAFTASPGKAGELIRLRYTERMGVPHTQGVAAFVFERMLDLVVLLMLGSLIADDAPGFAVAVGFVLAVLVAVVIVARSVVSRRILCLTLRRHGWRRSARWLRILLFGVSGAAQHLRSSQMVPAFAIGMLAWAIQCYGSAVALNRLGVALPLPVLFAVPAAAMLIGAASMIPGGIGTTEAAIVIILTHFGIDLPLAVLSAIALRVGSIWFAIVAGFIALIWLERH